MQLTLFPSDSLSSYRFFINTGKNFKRRLYTQQKFSYHLLSIQYKFLATFLKIRKNENI